MSENSENFANGISTHNLSHFPITEIKKYQNHTKFTQNLSVSFSVIFPFYSKNSYSITHKITPTTPKPYQKTLKPPINQQFSPNLIISLL
nr:MAG TPA: hypothetical protein [Caudoviricetes sp.]